LTARIGFGGPQFLPRGVDDGNEQPIHLRLLPVGANIDGRPVPHRERRREGSGERSQMSTQTAQNRKPGRDDRDFVEIPMRGTTRRAGLDSGRRIEPRAYGDNN
jgi:hypothetical protein